MTAPATEPSSSRRTWMKATVTTMSTACEQRGVTGVGSPASESEGLGCKRGTTYHGDACSVLIFFRDDAY